jgi:hypothetical protein
MPFELKFGSIRVPTFRAKAADSVFVGEIFELTYRAAIASRQPTTPPPDLSTFGYIFVLVPISYVTETPLMGGPGYIRKAGLGSSLISQ